MISPTQNTLINAALAPGQLAGQINAAVAAKSQQATRQQGDNVLQLLDSTDESSGSLPTGDPLVAAATGLGGNLDITA